MTSNLASDEIGAHGLELRRAQEVADKEKAKEAAAISVSREFKDHVVRPILKVSGARKPLPSGSDLFELS